MLRFKSGGQLLLLIPDQPRVELVGGKHGENDHGGEGDPSHAWHQGKNIAHLKQGDNDGHFSQQDHQRTRFW